MRSSEHGWIGVALHAIAALAFLFLVLPLLMMLPLSLEGGPVLRFPPQTISLHWYREYFANPLWLASTLLSFKVALGAACLAGVAGTLAAIALARIGSRWRALLSLLFMSPILLPTIVVAIAIYSIYATLRLVGTPLGLVVAHGVLTLPFVLLNVSAAMVSAPAALEEAALSLGARPLSILTGITLPLIARGIGAGAVFAFLVSFDEVVIAKFLSGMHAVTLPKRMLDGMFYEITPMLASISVLLIVLNVVLAIVGFALAQTRRPPTPGARRLLQDT